MGQLLANIDSAPVQDKPRPLLRYARKLTLEPARMTQINADAAFAAGWGEAGLSDAVLTICLFKFMNRAPDSHRVNGHAKLYASQSQPFWAYGYTLLLAALSPAKPR